MSDPTFTSRKLDHLKYALLNEVQAVGQSGLEHVQLIHDSLPEINLDDVSIQSTFLDQPIATPFYVAGMTGGFDGAETINQALAEMAASRGWLFGVGSQRRELDPEYQDASLSTLVLQFPKLKLISNLGLAQLIELHHQNRLGDLFTLLERNRASLLAVHLNPLQEAIQPEGTPDFRGGMEALTALMSLCPIPVVVKETGSGMSARTIQKLDSLALFAVDISGKGGTHWGRVEGKRAKKNSLAEAVSETFADWGVPTVQSLLNAKSGLKPSTEIWASGGVRSGLDAAKLLALGATRVGFAMPALHAALDGRTALEHWAERMEKELRIAMFCSGCANVNALQNSREGIGS